MWSYFLTGRFAPGIRHFLKAVLGLGWWPNPRTVIKVEVGKDWFEVIDASTFTPQDDDRWLAGMELVVAF